MIGIETKDGCLSAVGDPEPNIVLAPRRVPTRVIERPDFFLFRFISEYGPCFLRFRPRPLLVSDLPLNRDSGGCLEDPSDVLRMLDVNLPRVHFDFIALRLPVAIFNKKEQYL